MVWAKKKKEMTIEESLANVKEEFDEKVGKSEEKKEEKRTRKCAEG